MQQPETILNQPEFAKIFAEIAREVLIPAGELEQIKRKVYLTAKQVEALYGIPESSLRKWRSKKSGPKFYQHEIGGRVFYTHEDIKAFMTQHYNSFAG